MSDVSLKTCTKCSCEKPATNEFFSKHKLGKSGLNPRCRVCERARKREYEAANPDKRRAIKRRYREKNHDRVIDMERAAAKARYWADPEKARANRTAWRLANPEKFLAGMRLWYSKNKEYSASCARKWAEDNREKSSAIKAAWRKRNPEKNRECSSRWQKENRDAANAVARNRKARKRNAEGRHTAEETQAIRRRQGGLCAYCRSKLNRSAHLDHIQPLAAGGSNWPSNLQWLCAPCNRSKSARDPIEFAQSRGLLL